MAAKIGVKRINPALRRVSTLDRLSYFRKLRRMPCIEYKALSGAGRAGVVHPDPSGSGATAPDLKKIVAGSPARSKTGG